MSAGKKGQTRPHFTDQEALQFHSQGRPGKLEVVATKPMATQRDLSLAYSPGVAIPVLAIAEDESRAYDEFVQFWRLRPDATKFRQHNSEPRAEERTVRNLQHGDAVHCGRDRGKYQG